MAPLAPPRSAVPAGPYGMLMFAPPALMSEHGVPSAFPQGGKGGGSEWATGATEIATTAAPAITGVSSSFSFAIMSSVYHQKDKRDNSVGVTLLPRCQSSIELCLLSGRLATGWSGTVRPVCRRCRHWALPEPTGRRGFPLTRRRSGQPARQVRSGPRRRRLQARPRVYTECRQG